MYKPKYLIPLKHLVLAQKGTKPLILQNSPFLEGVPYLDISVLEGGPIKEYTFKELGMLSTENDVLVVWDGSRSGLAFKGKNGAIGSTLMGLTPIRLDQEYLYFFLRSKFDLLNKNLVGTGIPHVDQKLFYDLEIPYIELAQQKKVIKDIKIKIEQNSAILKAQESSIESVLGASNISYGRDENLSITLKNFKQSILQKAVSGNLTSKWRHQNRSLLDLEKFRSELIAKKLESLSEKEDPETIEKAIKEAKIENERLKVQAHLFCSTIASGSTPKVFQKSGVPFLKVYNMVRNTIDFHYKPQYISPEIHNTALKRSKVLPNDVLLNIVGPPLGKVAMVPNDFEEWNINQAIVLFRCLDVILPEFLFILLLEGEVIRDILPSTKGVAGQTNISLTQCREFTFLIPSILEQEAIVSQVKKMFQLVDEVERKYHEALEHFNNLEKSILSEAFDIRGAQGEDKRYKSLIAELKSEKERLEGQRKVSKKKQFEFKKKYFMNNSLETIKEQIKRVTLEKFEEVDISQTNRKEIFEEIRNNIPLMDFDDFSSAFQTLAQDPLRNERDEKVFDAIKKNGKLYYKLIKRKNEAPIPKADK